MKILTISNLYPPDGLGGYERQSAEMVDALKSRGHEMLVLTTPVSTRPVALQREPDFIHRVFHLANEYKPATNDPTYLLAQSIKSRFIDTHNISLLIEQLRRFRPDVVMLCNTLGLGGLQILSTLDVLGVPWIWSLADPLPPKLCDGGPMSNLVARFPLAKNDGKFLFEGTFVTPSKRLVDYINDDGCVLDGALHVVPYWVVGEPDKSPARDYFSREKPLRACFVGYVGANKGMDIVLHAMKLVQERKPGSVTLGIYGSGEVEKFKAMTAELALQDVEFYGFQNSQQIKDCYNQNDVLLFPAMLREPFGNVTLEAAMRGCVPIMNSQCGGAEFLRDGETCIQVERNAESFATAIMRVLDGDIDLGQFARTLPAKVYQRFKLADAAATYESILSSKAKPFSASDEKLDDARIASMQLENEIFEAVESELSSERASTDWLKSEVKALTDALTEAKKAVTAFDQALTGEKNKRVELEERLRNLENSRIWKLRKVLHPLLKDKTTDI